MTERVAAVFDDPDAASGESVATGDTLFGNALSRVATEAPCSEMRYRWRRPGPRSNKC